VGPQQWSQGLWTEISEILRQNKYFLLEGIYVRHSVMATILQRMKEEEEYMSPDNMGWLQSRSKNS
jgi:hypothetical protein